MASTSLRTRSLAASLSCKTAFSRSCSRTYATQAHAADYQVASAQSGIKVATFDDAAPTSAITVAVKAGPRYEPAPGLAHVLKDFVYKSTSKRSALRLTRESELLGGVLSSSLSREHLFLTAECLRGDEPYFAEILGDVLTQSKFKAHEYIEEVVPAVAQEYEAASRLPNVLAIDFAHQVAFRRGLGNSLFASPHLEVNASDAIAFARSSFANPSGVAVVASGGLASGQFKDVVDEFFTSSSAAVSSSSPNAANTSAGAQSKYFGGEMRVAVVEHGEEHKGHYLVAFEGGSHAAPEYSVLKALLGGEAATKWGTGIAPLAQLSGPRYASPAVRAFNLAYSDAGLIGFTVDARLGDVGKLARSGVEALKKIADGGVKEDEFKRGLAQAKFEVASTLERRVSRQELIAAQVLENGKITSLADAFSALDAVTAEKVQKAAQAALKSRPTTIAVGNTHKLPYSDELGL